MFNWIIGWLVDLPWRKILVPLLFVLFRKQQNNHYSVYLFNTSWKPSNENFETWCDKTGYILHSCCTSPLQVRDSLRQTERYSQERKKWWQFSKNDKNILERHIYLGRLVPRIEICEQVLQQITSVDCSIVKRPIRLRDSRGQNLAAGTRSCERLYQSNFSERPT